MDIIRIAAFSYNNQGGNPAGVAICSEMPTEKEMLATAKQVGYSESAFLTQVNDGWRIRYFAPEMEVPFCGHATIASGAVLGEHFGEGIYKLFINEGEITVSVSKSDKGNFVATLESPKTWSENAPKVYVETLLKEFNLTIADIDINYPVRFAFAGAKHLIVVLKELGLLPDIFHCSDCGENLEPGGGRFFCGRCFCFGCASAKGGSLSTGQAGVSGGKNQNISVSPSVDGLDKDFYSECRKILAGEVLFESRAASVIKKTAFYFKRQAQSYML